MIESVSHYLVYTVTLQPRSTFSNRLNLEYCARESDAREEIPVAKMERWGQIQID